MKKAPENEVLDYNRLGKEIQREIYSKSYYEFYKDAFCQLHPGKSYDENWHAKYICNRLQEEYYRIQRGEIREKDLIINIPFRASKSMIITVIFPIWCWSQDPSMKFITVSYSGDLAIEHSRFSKNLMHSVWFQRLYGNKVMLKPDAKATSHYETTKTGMRKAVGTGGQITGSGADIIICLRGDQKIQTDHGEIEIQRIVDGEMKINILSYNHLKGKIEYKPILRYDKNSGRKVLKIRTAGGEEIICTEEHEVWTENRGYVKANFLQKNDIVRYV